eukprot:Protomagalhaensia_sp_Gyna_25__1831@NODE_196_length_4510_cov_17_615746_g151_i0_p2_GENE_NODE_196_length_4510_cov_17_615746_g151_i0NODE_196_length_4510_cov_17_615746_g151_i0_p2_ORF_typecomplete_len513_score78_18_NODE_196_length_4510_cov_17_615746_g151_i023393877
MLNEILLQHLYSLLWPEEWILFLRLCQQSRCWVLQPEFEKRHMLECLELTLGCCKETGVGGYRQCGPPRSERWGKKLLMEKDLGSKRVSMSELCVEDSEEDACDCALPLLPPPPESRESQSTPVCSRAVVPVKNWLTLRIRLERQVIQYSAPDTCYVGEFRWHRIPDRELDRLSFRLRHFCPDWLKPEGDFEADEYHHFLGVYVPERSDEEAAESGEEGEDSWYIGDYVMRDTDLKTIEYLYEDSFQLYLQCFSYEANMCSGRLHRGHSKREFYTESTTYWSWVPGALHSDSEGITPSHPFTVPSLYLVPFLVRALLTQTHLLRRLCDTQDQSITPYSFLSAVQQIRLDSAAARTPLFGLDIRTVLETHSRVFKLEPAEFWDLNVDIGQDPTMGRTKFDLLCRTDGLDPWLYVCRSLACHEKSSQHEALDRINDAYPGLIPFDLRPIEAKLRLEDGYDPLGGSRGMLAVLDLNLPSKQFVPPPHDPQKRGMFGTFQVGQRAAVLHVRKIGCC